MFTTNPVSSLTIFFVFTTFLFRSDPRNVMTHDVILSLDDGQADYDFMVQIERLFVKCSQRNLKSIASNDHSII